MVSSLGSKMYACNEYATWQVMEEYLPRNIHDQFRKFFNEFDVHGNGVISIDHLPLVAARYGQCLTIQDAKTSLHSFIKCDHEQQCELENIKFVDFSEFLVVMMSIYTNVVSEDEIKKVFDIFDQDGDGFIGREELKSLLSKLGDEISEEEVEEMIREADRDGDGLVSYQEFVRIITNSVENEKKRKSINWSVGSTSSNEQLSESSSLSNKEFEDDDVFVREEQISTQRYTKIAKSKRKLSIRRSFRRLTRSKTRTISGNFPMDTVHEEEADQLNKNNNNALNKCKSLPTNIRYQSKAYLEAYSKPSDNELKSKNKSASNFAQNLIKKSRTLRRSLSISR